MGPCSMACYELSRWRGSCSPSLGEYAGLSLSSLRDGLLGITEVFVDTCYLAVVRNNDDWGSIPDNEAVDILKEVQAISVEGIIDSITPLVKDRGREARLEIYQSSLQACIESEGRYAF